MLSTNVQLTAADPQQCTVRQLLSIQLHLDEIIFSGMWVLDSHLQNELWETERKEEQERERRKKKAIVSKHYATTATELPDLHISVLHTPHVYREGAGEEEGLEGRHRAPRLRAVQLMGERLLPGNGGIRACAC